MKKIVTGSDAFEIICMLPSPAHTRTYKPYSHLVAYTTVKTALANSKYEIEEEEFRVSNDGKISFVSFYLKSSSEKRGLTCSYINSYSKQYGFKLVFGAYDVESKSVFAFKNATYGSNVLLDNKIKDLLETDVDKHFTEFEEMVRVLNGIPAKDSDCNNFFGKMFFQYDTINTYQMNIIKSKIKELRDEGWKNVSAYSIYNICANSMNETHPTEWVFNNVFLTDVVYKDFNVEEKTVLDHLGEVFEKREFKTYDFPSTTVDPTFIEHSKVLPNKYDITC
jgi:hypothetical protein